MNNERFNYIENKIREAAMHAEPPFDEVAWQKMEKKLDQKNDRRRPIIFWLVAKIFLLLGLIGAIYFATFVNQSLRDLPIDKNVRTGTAEHAPSGTVARKGDAGDLKNADPNESMPSSTRSSEIINSSSSSFSDISGRRKEKKFAAGTSSPRYSLNVYAGAKNRKKNNQGTMRSSITSAKLGEENLVAEDGINAPSQPAVEEAKFSERLQEIVETNLTGTVELKEKMDKEMAAKKSLPDSVAAESNKNTGEKKVDNKRKSGVYFTASAGPEITAVSPARANGRDLSTRFGIGVGYQFNKRLGLQLGLYSVAKKYVAGKDDYKPKDASYLAAANDLVIDANCRVIEIPVSVKYNFLSNGKTTWFISGGLAGVLMKKERYKFTYTEGTYPYLANYTDEKAFTGNRHFLSFAQISGGLARRVSPTLQLVAEPYVSVPLQGVGEGRVKLFSAGVQVGIKFMPLKK